MAGRKRMLLGWLLGLLAVLTLLALIDPGQVFDQLTAIGWRGAGAWLLLTLAARLLQVEITVRPLRVLGYRLPRLDAFWLGWLRTFSNQVLPVSGVALYATAIQRRSAIPWSEMAALATPQFLLASVALGGVAAVGVAAGHDHLGAAVTPLLLALAGLLGVSLLAVLRAPTVLRWLPRRLSTRLGGSATAFERLNAEPMHLIGIVVLQVLVIVLRGLRIWLLFALCGASMGWQEALLVIAVAEAAMLIQLTPGGLGLREGAIVGAAMLIGLSSTTGAAVALADRLLVIALTSLMLLPSINGAMRGRSAPPAEAGQ